MHDYDEDRTEQCTQCKIGSRTCGRRIVVKLMTDTKHRAASLRQQSYTPVSAVVYAAADWWLSTVRPAPL